MKTRLVFLFLIVTLHLGSTPSLAETLTVRQKIKLKNETSEGSRSIPILPEAYIECNLLSVDFFSVATSVTIIVKNTETGEIVYLSTDLNVDKVDLDLAGEETGKYILVIQLSTETFIGNFEI